MGIELTVVKCDYPGCENRVAVFSTESPELSDHGWERRGVIFVGMKRIDTSYVCRQHAHVQSDELFRLTDK